MNTPNRQTPGPLQLVGSPRLGFTLHALLPHDMGQSDALATVKSPALDSTQANARLLAAAYTALDKAGRELGIDAATLAEGIDLAALVRLAHEIRGQCEDGYLREHARWLCVPERAALANLPKPTP